MFEYSIANDTGIPDERVMQELNAQYPEMMSHVTYMDGSGSVTEDASSYAHTSNNPYEDASVTYGNHGSDTTIFKQMLLARMAAKNDDIVSGTMDTTEALAVRGHSVEISDNLGEENLWKDVLKELSFSEVLRQQWRDLYRYSQGYAGTFWGRRSFTVDFQSKADSIRKKTYRKILVPTKMTLFDPLSIMPKAKTISFNDTNEYLYLSFNMAESERIRDVLRGKVEDEYVKNFIVSEEVSNNILTHSIFSQTKTPDAVFLMKNVYRFSLTKDPYSLFSDVRLASVFDLLDLKANLKIRDRAHLIGSSNVIITVKKGSDKFPAKQEEIDSLNRQMNQGARVPIIVDDHRLEVEIATFKDDGTLASEKYNNLDSRLTARLFHLFMAGGYSAGTSKDSSASFIQVASRALEAHREVLVDAFYEHVGSEILRRNNMLECDPKITASPKRIALDFDPAMFKTMLELRDRGDLSRETLFSFFDIDQKEEFDRRNMEAKVYDKSFTQTNVPFSSTDGVAPSVSGAAGGGSNLESFTTTGNEHTKK